MTLRRDDPILFQVLKSAFTSIVDEMGALIQRVAISLVVSEGRDYCGTICTREGDLVTSGTTDLPAHLGTHPFTIRGMLEWVKVEPEEYLRPGDIVIMNDAYIGGTHNHDVRLIMPVYFSDRIVAFVINSSHWTDIGGHVPGTFDPGARSSHGEGLIIPPCHLVREDKVNDELVDLILRNVRVPEATHGDMLAQIGAIRLGEKRLQELRAAHGDGVVLAAMQEVIDYSESLLRAEIARLEDGTWETEAFADSDPGIPGSPPVAMRMALTIDGNRAIYDFTRSDPQAKGAINAPVACTVSAALVATKAIFSHVPMNQGVFNAVEFRLPQQPSVVNAAYPAPISGMAAAVFPGIVNCVLKAFAHVVPHRCMAGPTGLTNITWGGYDSRPGHERDYVCYLWLEGGWGGRLARKDNHTAMTLFATSATNQPVELHERTAPLVFDCYRLETDSGGAGASRGSNGVTRRWYVSHGDAVLSCLGSGQLHGPWGFAGGCDAPPNRFVYAPDTGEGTNIGMFVTGFQIDEGRILEYRQAGGGGWGDPFSRDPAWVLEDVVDGYVSPDGARKDYGVVVEVGPAGYRIDQEATDDLRSSSRSRVSEVRHE
jgi:N-methylhydantoinase B